MVKEANPNPKTWLNRESASLSDQLTASYHPMQTWWSGKKSEDPSCPLFKEQHQVEHVTSSCRAISHLRLVQIVAQPSTEWASWNCWAQHCHGNKDPPSWTPDTLPKTREEADHGLSLLCNTNAAGQAYWVKHIIRILLQKLKGGRQAT